MEKSEIVEGLRKVRELLSDPSRHCTRHYAKTSADTPVFPNEPDGVRWCLVGACIKIAPGDADALADVLRIASYEVAPCKTLVEFNDSTPHRVILKVMDRAIEIAEAA